MPGRGTTRRTIRVAEDLWAAAKRTADERGDDISAVIRKALEQYVARHERRKKR